MDVEMKVLIVAFLKILEFSHKIQEHLLNLETFHSGNLEVVGVGMEVVIVDFK